MIPQKYEATQTMSSREIADLTGKQHAHVMRDIRKMLIAIGKDLSNFGSTYKDAQGRDQTEYRLDRELTLTLVSGYDIPLRHRVVTRLAELENSRALSPAQLILAQAQALVAQEQRMNVIEEKVKQIEANLPREQDYFTIIGWARYIGITVSNSEALGLGRKAAKYSRDRGVSIGNTTDPRYGLVHTYHCDILEDAFGDYFDAKAA